MNHKRLITIAPGEVYEFRVTVADIAGASLTFADLFGGSAQQIGPGETVEVRVEAKPRPMAAAVERNAA
jgi:hypothetical protein